MFLKFPLSVLLLSFLATSLALPERFGHSIGDGSLSKDAGETVNELTKEVEKTIKHLTQDSQWIFNNLVSVLKSGVTEGFETLTTYALDFILRAEFLMMADGSHYIFPLSGKQETEQEYRAVSIAVSKVLMNLKTMEQADKVIRNVTKNLVSKDISLLHFKEQQKYAEKMFRTFLHEYIEALDRQMETDEVLRDEYKKRVAEARVFVKQAPKMEASPFKVWEKDVSVLPSDDELNNIIWGKKTFIRAAVNKRFLRASVKHFDMIFSSTQHQHYLLARAFIQKAVDSSSSESKINDIYQQALVATSEVNALKRSEDLSEEVLFEQLETTLKSHPVLEGEIRDLMKEIEKNTVYNTDMLYVDFNLL